MEGANGDAPLDPPRPVTLTRISAQQFASKYKSKRECYNFLAGDCECYLPPYGK